MGYIAVTLLLKSKTDVANVALIDAKRRIAETETKLEARARELQIEGREEVQREVQRLREIIERSRRPAPGA